MTGALLRLGLPYNSRPRYQDSVVLNSYHTQGGTFVFVFARLPTILAPYLTKWVGGVNFCNNMCVVFSTIRKICVRKKSYQNKDEL